MVHTLAEIDPSVKLGGCFIGQFCYNYEDVLGSNVSMDGICNLAFGSGGGDPTRIEWCNQLKQMAQSEPTRTFRSMIDEIRINAGREPAIVTDEVSVENQTQSYYVLTPPSSNFDPVTGAVIQKIRTLSILPLTLSQVNLLESKGYDILLSGAMDILTFAKQFDQPIRFANSTDIINNQPVTIFPDGQISDKNEGIFIPLPESGTDEAGDFLVNDNGSMVTKPVIVNETLNTPEPIPSEANFLPFAFLLFLTAGG